MKKNVYIRICEVMRILEKNIKFIYGINNYIIKLSYPHWTMETSCSFSFLSLYEDFSTFGNVAITS